MKITLQESYAGELDALTLPERRGKLRKAMTQVAEQLGVAGGEVDVIDDLVAVLDKAYDKRKRWMLRDLARTTINAAE